MADRYWVGGTANWDGTAGTKWATTSGGAGGASVPTSADDVFFTNLSTGTCTITSATCKSLNCTGFAGTISGSGLFTSFGNITLDAGMTFTHTGSVTISGACTITSAGKTFGGLVALGASVTLADAFQNNGTLRINGGTFTTNNYSVVTETLESSNSNSRTINLGSSTITVSGSNPINFSTNTNLTFNAGTSSITCPATSVTITPGPTGGNVGVTFYNLAFTSTASATHQINAANTFNNLTITGPSSAGVRNISFDSRQTINGTLSTTGTAGNRRVWFRGVTYGIAQTLTINATPSLTDADFRDIYVIGTAAPISGTRIGDLKGCRGITFDTPKTVYWNLAGAQNWSANGWSDTSTGTPNTNFFPLAQDTATFTNAGSVTGTITMDTAVPYTGTVDMSGRTSAMTLSVGAFTIYGDWKNGSGTTLPGTGTLTFSGRNTQTITSAGKAFNGGVTVDTYGGSVELADALDISPSFGTLTITNGAFDTKNFNVTASGLASNNSNVRTIALGSSTLTMVGSSAINFASAVNLTFSAGTSQVNCTLNGIINFQGGGQTFYNVSFTFAQTSAAVITVSQANTFTGLTFTAPSGAGLQAVAFAANQTITGTLTVAGATAVRRIFVRSDTLGTQRTLSVGTLSATDCDFRDIAITGAAAGSSPTRAGDCGGNSGITFPAAKTVYWNLAGAQNWSATAWAPSSGGTPDINQFPLAQDTAVFDNTGSVTGTITINQAWNIGTFDASARTSAMTFNLATCQVYGNWSHGSGLTFPGQNAGVDFFRNGGTQTITSNGVSFGNNRLRPGTVNGGRVLLADAFTTSGNIQHGGGEFDANGFNVTAGGYESTNTVNVRVLRMGGGLWTLTGTGSLWSVNASTTFTLYKSTSNILLSDTSTSARTFAGGNLSYNKLTIGGATGISTLTIDGNNQFTELASTKTVAHTIALGSTTQTFGKWTVTGTAGNVVTLTGTGTSHILAGACTSGIDYLAMGSIGFAATSPGEFYAGANSTATAAVAPVYLTAKPADSTRYWVGGTGNWSDTARWSTSSGGAGGASVPRSHDDVVFDSLSNATAYTATVNAVTGGIRMKALTIAGPLVGNVTLAGSTAMVGIHGNVTLPATGLTRTYTGAMTLSGSTTGLTFTTNGVTLSSAITVNGVDCGWSLGSALDAGSTGFTVTNGSFSCSTYNLTASQVASDNLNTRTVNFGSGTVTLSGSAPVSFGTTETARANLTITAGTAQLNFTSANPSPFGNNQTFYNVSFTATSAGTVTLNGANSFNNLSFTGITAAGLKNISLSANQTVTGTLTFSAGTDATMRHFCRSDTIGTTRTITAAAVSMTDVDFRDITIAGAAAPASGTRIGDCKGNSGITFTAAANKYWNLAVGGNWSAIGWATSSGGIPDINNFPLAQDTCIFEATGLNSGATITVVSGYNIGTIDMSARTTNTMTLSHSTGATIHGDWINGTGVTISGTSAVVFAGRITQNITSAGVTFTQLISINSPGGSVVLQDAFINSRSSSLAISHEFGTFDANGYNVTLTNGSVTSGTTNVRTLAVGSGTWTIAGATAPWNMTPTNLTVTGTGTISLTSASSKSFVGGSIDYSGITLNQGGNGTLTITGNNTFKTISSTAAGANTINIGTTTQRITTSWTAAGTAGNVQTVTGSSATSPGTLVFTGSGQAANVDYLAITGVRAYSLTDTWYAGGNSTNNGSLGWIFAAAGGTIYNVSFSDTATGADALNTSAVLNVAISDTATGTDTLNTTATLNVAFSDTATGADAINVNATLSAAFSDTATGADAASTTATLNVSVSDTASGLDAVFGASVISAAFADTASAADVFAVQATFNVAFSDTASGTDAISATATLIAAFSDAASILDDPAVAASIFNVTLDEVASGLDILSPAGSTFNVSLSESGTLVDLVAGDYLWNPIDDSQSPNWQNVVTAPPTSWVDINNAQAPGWVDIQT